MGDSKGAYAELQDGLQIWRALDEEPTLVSGLVQMSSLTTLLGAVGAGLKERAWAVAELEKIATDFYQIQVWKSYRRVFVSERAFYNSMYESIIDSSLSKRRSQFRGLSSSMTFELNPGFFVLIPNRVYRENQLRTNRYLDEIIARARGKSGFDANAPLPSDPGNLRGPVEPYYFFLFRWSAGLLNVADRYVTVHTMIDEMHVACALERYRLAQRQYPETLQELTPAFLEAVPRDLFSGKPLIYQSKKGEPYILYGVGKNRMDDGGVVDSKRVDQSQHDDIWFYAPPVP